MLSRRIILPTAIVSALAMAGTAGFASSASATSTSGSPTLTAESQPASHSAAQWVENHRQAIGHAVVTISAEDIGVTPLALVTELRSGKSIAQVAGEYRASTTALQTDLVNAADSRVNTLVGNGKLTSTQGSKIEARIPALVNKIVNRTF
jgi:DUF917 family protein